MKEEKRFRFMLIFYLMKNGSTLIMGRITLAQHQKAFSTKLDINIKNGDTKHERVVCKSAQILIRH